MVWEEFQPQQFVKRIKAVCLQDNMSDTADIYRFLQSRSLNLALEYDSLEVLKYSVL